MGGHTPLVSPPLHTYAHLAAISSFKQKKTPTTAAYPLARSVCVCVT